MSPSFPVGLDLWLDPDVRAFRDGRLVLGGDPGRLLRFRKPVLTRPWSPSVARLLVDGGFAHPRPARVAVRDVHVIVPVRDRIEELRRCLAALGPEVSVTVVDDGSLDPQPVAELCRRRGASLVRQANSGPAGARNAGVAATSSGIVAFVDSDVVVRPGWLEGLLGHFADPAVAAVAPRVRAEPARSPLSRYAAACGPLDLGPREARVRPGGRVSYVPTAALLVRRTAFEQVGGFDPRLRFGEDVDLVWRLHDDGWTVRYDPRTEVVHAEPGSWWGFLRRKHAYGTSAGPLSLRHPDRLAPLVLSPWLSGSLFLLGTALPGPALMAAAVPAARLLRQLLRSGVPPLSATATSIRLTGKGLSATLGGLGQGGSVVTIPLLVGGLLSRRTRTCALLGLVAPPLRDHARSRPAVDPARWTVLRLADDAAYATGVWRSCVRERTLAPLRPRRSGDGGGRRRPGAD